MNTQALTIETHRILTVDDDDVLRGWLRAQLEPRGFEVWEESQGDEALATHRQNGPWDFVLSDFYFFRGEIIRNGLELVQAIAAVCPEQHMAIHTSEPRLDAPCAVLRKPYTLGALLKLLRKPVTRLKVKRDPR
jgi:CheY-like chemotaxis protein